MNNMSFTIPSSVNGAGAKCDYKLVADDSNKVITLGKHALEDFVVYIKAKATEQTDAKVYVAANVSTPNYSKLFVPQENTFIRF